MGSLTGGLQISIKWYVVFWNFAHTQFTGYAEYIRFSHKEHLKMLESESILIAWNPNTFKFLPWNPNPTTPWEKRLWAQEAMTMDTRGPGGVLPIPGILRVCHLRG